MTKEDIIRIARKAGMRLDKHNGGFVEASELERFAALVASAEREACAKVCEDWMEIFPDFGQYCKGGIDGLTKASAAIRARGQA